MTTTIEEGKKGRKISTHILTKRMTWPRRKMEVHWGISTHILTKRMTVIVAYPCPPDDISTHILTKRMTILYIWSDMNKIFQLTSSRRGWLLSNHPHRFLEYFNSHPHEEDDSIRRLFGLYTNISTHILTKRMTFWGTHDICRYHISTHILTKRMTDLYDHLHHLLEFQLTSSRRGWPKQILLDGSAELISTHILTKRMTVILWKD